MSDLPLHLDYDTSTAILDGRSFPACLMICPDDEDFPEPDPIQRSLGGDSRYTINALIPVESGLIVSIDMEKSTGDLWCCLWSRTCTRKAMPYDDTLWLPQNLRIRDGQVVVGFQSWDRCEPWWLVEFIDRVARMGYQEPPGIAAELIPLTKFDLTVSHA